MNTGTGSPVANASEILFDNLPAGREHRVAIRYDGNDITYGDLCRKASRAGNALTRLGLTPGNRILLVLLDTPHFPAVFLGAMRAGLIPIPVNTNLRQEDYAGIIEDSDAVAMLVDAALHAPRAAARRHRGTLRHQLIARGRDIPVDHDWDRHCDAAPDHLDPAPVPEGGEAFWLYSSGSTGPPKGVVHTHRSIRHTIDAYARGVLDMHETDRTFSASKAYHAYGLGNSVTFPCGVGASTVLLPDRPTPERVFAILEQERPSLFFTAPTHYAGLLADNSGHRDLSSLRLCVSAAEALPPSVYTAWRDRFGLEILDGIGSTEMLHIFISNRPGRVRPGTSGTEVPGYEVRIVDDGNVATRGASGILEVRGDSRAREYWNHPERTAATMPGEWFVTGDRYHQDADGYYHYEGRADDMFKVSGQWVSPTEVENALLQHPAVLECAVVPFVDDAGLTRPRAVVRLKEPDRAGGGLVTELQHHVKTTLAPHTYPRRVEFVRALPRTATGKIQRFQLRGES